MIVDVSTGHEAGTPSFGTPPQYPIGLDHRRAGPQIGPKSPPGGSNQGQKPRKSTCEDLLILIVARQASRPSLTPRAVARHVNQLTTPQYKLRIELNEVQPTVWRGLLVPENVTLVKLSLILQQAMGWHGGHLHEYIVGRAHYGIPDDDWPSPEPFTDERRVRLNTLVESGSRRFILLYDFADGASGVACHGSLILRSASYSGRKVLPLVGKSKWHVTLTKIAQVGPSHLLQDVTLGRTVVADSVNPLQITRNAWRAAADAVGASAVEVEVICSNAAERRRRVESRRTDIPGLSLPSWQEVCDREYDQWD